MDPLSKPQRAAFVRRTRGLALVLLCVVVPSTAWAENPFQPSFTEVVERHFRAWDQNHDGRLEKSEIDRLMTLPSIEGEAAAAIATIKLRERKTPAVVRPRFAVGLDQLRGQAELGLPLVNSDIARLEPAHTFNFERQYRSYCNALERTPNRLFAGQLPDFQRMRQGPNGDCFFFSVTGCVAALHPRRIVSMITPAGSGSYMVRFPGMKPVHVPRLTEAEALVNNTTSTLEDGIWMAVLEKAVGELIREHAHPDRRSAEPTDAIASGGSTVRMLHLYTGHASIEFRLRDPGAEAERLGQIRWQLSQALNQGRLVATSMGSTPAGPAKVPGLGYNHAYAVLGYDDRSDLVTLWNPWGNTFTPRGLDSPQYGFRTTHGVFRVPLRTLYRNWSSLHIESQKPLMANR